LCIQNKVLYLCIQTLKKNKMKLQKVIKEYNNTNKINIVKRYRLQKELRLLIDPVHLIGSHSILYTIIFK